MDLCVSGRKKKEKREPVIASLLREPGQTLAGDNYYPPDVTGQDGRVRWLAIQPTWGQQRLCAVPGHSGTATGTSVGTSIGPRDQSQGEEADQRKARKRGNSVGRGGTTR